MIIIKENVADTISIRPRFIPSAVTINVRDTSLNKMQSFSISSFTTLKDRLTLDVDFGSFVKENRFYEIICWDNTSSYKSESIFFKSLMFCTDQLINQTNDDYYSVNKQQYIADDTNNNEYIIL